MQEKSILIKNARIVNEGKIIEGDVLIENQFITEISLLSFLPNHLESNLKLHVVLLVYFS